MRTNIVRWFAFSILGFLVACGGGGGGSGGGTSPSPDPIGTDPGVVAASESVLANAFNPDAALQDAVAQVQELYQSDPVGAQDKATKSFLDSVQTSQDFANLFESMKNAPEVFAPPPPASIQQQAVGVDCPVQEGGTVYYFVNGIWTTHIEAINMRQALAEALYFQDPSFHDYDMRLFYNTSGLDSENVEAFCRAIVGYGTWEFFDIQRIWNAFLMRSCVATLGGIVDVGQLVAQWAQQWLQFDPGASQPQVVQFRNLIQQDVLSGKTVVIVAHSQGNFFAQQAIDGLPSDSLGDMKQSVGVVSLASPANYPQSFSYGYFAYEMLERDIVSFAPATLAPNGTNSVSLSSAQPITVHNFMNSYLGASESRGRIVSDVEAAASVLSNPRTSAGQGFFQVTSTWDIDGDIDLHVFEPGSTHVYYGDASGVVGKLDRDDITGSGPENYFVCQKSDMVAGDYDVYVNNYGGTFGTTVTITIRAGTQVRSYQKVVGSSNGSSTPTLFVVTVSYNSDGTFTFGSGSGGGETESGY